MSYLLGKSGIEYSHSTRYSDEFFHLFLLSHSSIRLYEKQEPFTEKLFHHRQSLIVFSLKSNRIFSAVAIILHTNKHKSQPNVPSWLGCYLLFAKLKNYDNIYLNVLSRGIVDWFKHNVGSMYYRIISPLLNKTSSL